ncbi:hypothetical protein PoB_006312400 [Plakobranchus ocellatus]|uniref:Tantalus-like domain-containing protein n=1 Tax=Plakobranchus ocellatus TaxID=259542 RepID=A0AAV4CXI9_9GAST|nr:hypothetical protein PoB_006312400 [Plakobranchus ocellatus]
MNKTVEKLHKNNCMSEVYFEQCCFKNTKKRKLLMKDALPTLFDIQNPPLSTTTIKRAPVSTSREDLPSSSCLSHSLEQQESTLNNEFESDEERQTLKRKLNGEGTKTSRLRKRMRLLNEKESLTKQPLSESDIGLQFPTQSPRKYLLDAACNFVCTQLHKNRLPKRGRKWTH